MARTHHHAPLTCQASAPEPAAADMGRQPRISQYASTVPTSGAPADHPCNSALTHGSHSASGQAPAAATDHSYQLFGQHLNGEPPTVHLHPHAQSLLAASQPITLPHTKSDEAMQHASPPIRPLTAQGWPSRDPRLMCLPHATHTAHPCGQAVSHTNLACSSPAESASDLQLTSAVATKPAPQSLPLPCKTSLGGLFGGLSPLACGPTKCSQAAALPLLEESSSVVLEGHRLDQAPVKFSDPFSSLDTSFPDPSQVQVAPMMPPLGERPGVVLKKYRSEWASGTFQHPFGPHDSHPDPAPDPTDGHTRPQSQHSVPLTFSSRALNPCAQSLQLTKDAPAPASMPRPYPSSSPRPGLYQPTASPTGLLMYPRHPESGIPSMLQAPGRDLQRIALKSAYRQTDSPYTAQPLKMVETSSGCGGVCTPHRPRALNRPASTWRWGLGDGTMLGSEDQKSGGSDGFSDAEDSSWEANAWYNQAESDGGVWQQGLGSDQGGAIGRKVPMGRPAGYVNAQGFSTSDIPGCQTQQAQGNGSRCEVERSHLSTHHDQHAAVESLSPLPGSMESIFGLQAHGADHDRRPLAGLKASLDCMHEMEDGTEALAILSCLAHANITAKQLRASGIANALPPLRQHEDRDVRIMATQLLDSWSQMELEVATANQHAPPGHTDRPPVPNNRHVPQPQRKILAKPDLHRPPLCSVRPAALNSQHTSQSQKKLARGVSKKPRGMASDGTNQPPVDQASQPPDHRLPAKKADKAKRLWHAQALRDVLSPASLRHYTTVTSVPPVLQGVDIVPKRHNQGRNDWSAKDKLTYITVLLKHGKDWEKLSAAFPERDPVAVRKFWTNHHRSLRLDQLMEERPELDTSALTTA
ncbi:hypothetical protein WJX84_003986 [Apatococcus fuscideae]|uniref:Myb-like domain-containing protein n=1 Tax=Apatococcus fuscideae TaxID=2026836 RepID=A0AAW1TGH5_9CHLO